MYLSVQSTNNKNTLSRQGLAVVIVSCPGPHAHTHTHTNGSPFLPHKKNHAFENHNFEKVMKLTY